jgi:hypothetical protein
MQKKEEILNVLAVSPRLSSIAVFENWHFAFTARKKSAYVFLVSQDNKQGNCNGKDSVRSIVYIKNDEDKYRESHAGHD